MSRRSLAPVEHPPVHLDSGLWVQAGVAPMREILESPTRCKYKEHCRSSASRCATAGHGFLITALRGVVVSEVGAAFDALVHGVADDIVIRAFIGGGGGVGSCAAPACTRFLRFAASDRGLVGVSARRG